ncbi:glutamate ABC transporter substrate-binding protein [Streptomyces xanthii]|uniref:Glutamate ABC transporter substrate-binding protein n=1 Tax=Streptomyces xanthii TaxID=2768069 RepID=A0A7H1BBV4_9ACTN|nr:glutamate ABC transporter substrate-binding protein [Streptomyces xanthii]QNS06209.1 glutamate ABC transporter substrate-binding protein [Streptomyces xanthii]
MDERRTRGVSLRGWGGVAAMAVVCALTAVFALLLPLTQRTAAPADGAGMGSAGVADGTQARATDCEAGVDGKEPERSLRPSGDESGDAVREIKDRGYLSVGVDQNSYRWGYRDPNNQDKKSELEGFDIDLAHEIAGEILGDPSAVRLKAIPTNERIPAIQRGDVDMVVRTMTISCERLKDVAFSTAYFQTGQQVLAPKTDKDIKGFGPSLADKRICTATGSTAFDTLDTAKKSGKLPASADISTTVPNQLDCLVRLQLGEVDAVVTDGALAASQAAQDPTVELKGDPFTEEYYGVAMKKDADGLVRRVNKVLEDYREDGGWQKSYDFWLKPALGASDGPPAPKYK